MEGHQRAAQALGMDGDEEQVDVIVHQSPAEAAGGGGGAGGGKQLEIGGAVLVREENRQSAVAALGHVMRDVGDDDTGETSHAGGTNSSTG